MIRPEVASALELAFAEPDDDSERRWSLIRTLQALPARTVELSEWAAGRPEREAGALIADVLGELGLPGTNDFERPERQRLLRRLLVRTGDDEVVASALVALGKVGAADDVERVLSWATHPNAEIRFAVAYALQHLPPGQAALETLLALAHDLDDEVREWAVFALAEELTYPPTAVEPVMWEALASEQVEVAAEGAVGLLNRGHEEVRERARSLLLALTQQGLPTARLEEVLDEQQLS